MSLVDKANKGSFGDWQDPVCLPIIAVYIAEYVAAGGFETGAIG